MNTILHKAIQFILLTLAICTIVNKGNASSNPDSLLLIVQESEVQNEALLDNILGLSLAYFPSDPEKMETFGKQAIELSELLNIQIKVAKANSIVGASFAIRNIYDKALTFFLNALSIAEELNDSDLLAKQLLNVAGIYTFTGEHEKAIEHSKRALDIFVVNGQNNLVADSYQSIGIAHKNIYDEIVQSEKASAVSPEVYNEKLNESLSYFMASLDSYLSLNDQYGVGSTYGHIGSIYEAKGLFAKAKSYYEKHYELAEINENEEGQSTACNNLAQVNMKLGDFSKAASFAEIAREEAFANGYRDEMLRSLLLLSEINEKNSRPRDALEFYKEYVEVKKEIEINESGKKVEVIKSKYESENRERENELLAKENENIKFRNRIYSVLTLAGLFLVLLSLIFVYRSKRRREKLSYQNAMIEQQNSELESLNETKDQLFAIIAHDLRAPAIAFQGIMRKLNYLIEREDYNRLHTISNELDKTSVNLINLIDNLLTWARHQKGELKYRPVHLSVEEIAKNTIEQYENEIKLKDLNVQVDVPTELKIFADRNALQSIFRNILGNAIKFSNTNQTINISAKELKDKVQVNFEDQGVGMSTEKVLAFNTDQKLESSAGTEGEKGTGIGLMICKQLVAMNNGNIQVKSKLKHGTNFSIELPRNL